VYLAYLDLTPSDELAVSEPPELFRLKCASHRYTVDSNSTHFKRNNPLVCQVSARYNHGSTGSKQVYLARRWVYNHSTVHQLLIYKNANVITNLFQTECKLIQIVFNTTSYATCPSSQRKENKHATTHVAKVDIVLNPKLGVTQEGHCQLGTDPTPLTSQTE
jgi:hypothetical protein